MSKFLVLTFAFLVAVSLAASPSSVSAQTDSGAAPEEIEEIETVEEIEVVEDAGSVKQAGLFQTIGHFHPVVLHFPIAWLILLIIVEVLVLSGYADELNRWGFALLVLTLLSFVPAIVSGLGLASSHSSAAAEFADKMLLHRNVNISSALTLLVAGVVRFSIGQSAVGKSKIGYYLLILIAAGLLMYGSHIGGEMVWGDGFLPGPF